MYVSWKRSLNSTRWCLQVVPSKHRISVLKIPFHAGTCIWRKLHWKNIYDANHRTFLEKYDNNVVLVAKKLGVGKSTIYRYLKENKTSDSELKFCCLHCLLYALIRLFDLLINNYSVPNPLLWAIVRCCIFITGKWTQGCSYIQNNRATTSHFIETITKDPAGVARQVVDCWWIQKQSPGRLQKKFVRAE